MNETILSRIEKNVAVLPRLERLFERVVAGALAVGRAEGRLAAAASRPVFEPRPTVAPVAKVGPAPVVSAPVEKAPAVVDTPPPRPFTDRPKRTPAESRGPETSKPVRPVESRPVPPARPVLEQKPATAPAARPEAPKPQPVTAGRDKPARPEAPKAPPITPATAKPSRSERDRPAPKPRSTTTAAGGRPSRSAQRLEKAREDKSDAKRNSLLARAVGAAVAKAGKGWDLAKDLLSGQAGQDSGDALGLATGGPIWSALREIAEVVDTTRDNQIASAAFGFLQKKWQARRGPEEKGAAEAKNAKAKGGAQRDEHGRFLKKADRVQRGDVQTSGRKPRRRPAAAPTTKSETVEAVGRVEEAIEAADKRETRRHRKLLREVDGINVEPAEGGLLGGAAGLLGMLRGGGIKGLLGGLAGAGAGGAVAGPLAKGAGKVLGKIGGTGLAKGTGKVLGKLGGKSLLKKIPGIGLLAGGAFAADRLADGDVLGAAGEAASGIASLIPGIGTVVSTAIDGALAARDLSREGDAPMVEPDQAGPVHKEIKESLQSGPKQDRIDPVAESRAAPALARQLPPVKEIAPPAPAPAPRPVRVPSEPKPAVEKSGRHSMREPYQVPTEFDDTLLALMAIDRI